jgi:phytoene desaturase
MGEPHLIIIGGGLAGLSSGCYGRANGFRTTIVEHNLALGGVCTAWSRGPYTIDGCIHWLTGGPFSHVYTELGILPKVPLRVIEHFATYRDAAHGFEIPITQDLDALATTLSSLAPGDADELRRIMDGAARVAELKPPLDKPEELMTLRDGLAVFWNLRHDLPVLAHFRKSFASYAAEHLDSELLRRVFASLVPAEAPAFFLLMMLGYLQRGYLSRPAGGTGPFRDALVDQYRTLGGEARLHTTVDEVLVRDGRACGVRLSDGTMIEADAVISTSSAPETVLRLLGGRYGADETRERLQKWKLFDPIVLQSFGVAASFSYAPPTLLIDHVEPFDVGGRRNDRLFIRIYNDDAAFAPPGHTVVQALLTTDYEWWATRGTRYGAEKDAIADLVLARLESHLPGIRRGVEVIDTATPLTYWSMARSWRGAYEGWMPRSDAFFGHVSKKLPELSGFYMAGQWVEPGGGVPTAVSSGRKAVQLLCAEEGRPFTPTRGG